MMELFVSDPHRGDGRPADNSLECVDRRTKRWWLRRLLLTCYERDIAINIAGDYWELYGTTWPRIMADKQNVAHLELLDVLWGRRVRGNHDWTLPEPEKSRLRLTNPGYMQWDLPTGRVHMEHGHSFDKINWRSDLWKWAAGVEYGIESDAWPGIDDAVSAVWNWLNGKHHRGRNAQHLQPGDPPYWWAAAKIGALWPAVTAVVLGHSHLAGVWEIPGGPTYVNCGNWSRDPQPPPLEHPKLPPAVYGCFSGCL